MRESGLQDLLSQNKKELDKIVLDFLPTTDSCDEVRQLYTMMRDYPSRGGKGLRGTMCLLWCELFGGKRDEALITAASIELFQNWILIHDDIEDDSDLRRGEETLHRRYGIPLSINAGDALHGKMWELLLRNKSILGVDRAFLILSEFSQMLNETTEGQQMELLWIGKKDWGISEQDYLTMVTKKAAWYTCISPARVGVILAGEGYERNLFEEINHFGTDLGISFQITDDLLNLTADETKYGKEILGDILEGKRTIMLIHLLRKLKGGERERLIGILEKPRSEKTEEDVNFIIEMMSKAGSLEYAKKLAKSHSDGSLSSFDKIVRSRDLQSSPYYKITRSLVEYLTIREY